MSIVLIFFTMRLLEQEKIAVIGLGYVGLPVAISFGRKLSTIGFDIRQRRVDQLKRGHDDTLEVTDEQLASAKQLELTADPSRCLLLYPLAAWEPIQSRLMALSSFNEQIRGLQRLLVGHADDVEIDAAGRILVPPALRHYASLDKHVVLVGQGRKFELWGQAQWQVETAQAIAFPADGLPPELDGFSL